MKDVLINSVVVVMIIATVALIVLKMYMWSIIVLYSCGAFLAIISYGDCTEYPPDEDV